jgi:hypothetical protein
VEALCCAETFGSVLPDHTGVYLVRVIFKLRYFHYLSCSLSFCVQNSCNIFVAFVIMCAHLSRGIGEGYETILVTFTVPDLQ